VDAAPALLSYWDTAERNVFANEAYARWFGREPDELRGLHLRELLGAEAYEDDREHIRRVLGGAPQRFERDVSNLAGTLHAEVACTPDVADGQVVGFAVAVTVLPAPRSAVARAGLRSRVRALVVDDDPLARAGLGAILRSGPGIEVAGEVATVEEALATVRQASPDVVLIDVRVPGMDDLLDAGRAFASGSFAFPAVIALTTSAFDEVLFEPLAAGASAVLAKRCSREQLFEGVRAAAGADPAKPRVARPTRRLSRREREVLELAVRGLSNKEVGKLLFISTDTVKSHLKKIYAKLELPGRHELVAAGYELRLHRP
jgi:PAS domain S-box-containing protein